jgi:hypothetical protein
MSLYSDLGNGPVVPTFDGFWPPKGVGDDGRWLDALVDRRAPARPTFFHVVCGDEPSVPACPVRPCVCEAAPSRSVGSAQRVAPLPLLSSGIPSAMVADRQDAPPVSPEPAPPPDRRPIGRLPDDETGACRCALTIQLGRS